jgi:hypothetical protein
VASAKTAPNGAGDTWTWTGIDADNKLNISWLIGALDSDTAKLFIDDLASRLVGRIQLTSDGLRIGWRSAMAAGVTDRLWEVADIVKVLEDWERNPLPRNLTNPTGSSQFLK